MPCVGENSDRPLALLVDGDALVLWFVSGTFEEAGFDVLAARNAKDARLILATSGTIAAAFVETVWPDASGMELACALRSANPELAIAVKANHPLAARAAKARALTTHSGFEWPASIARKLMADVMAACAARADHAEASAPPRPGR